MATTALFVVLEHPDRDHLCKAVADVMKMLEERGIVVKPQGYMVGDNCWSAEVRLGA